MSTLNTVKVKAFVKYNRLDKQQVLYFQGGNSVYKMLSPKNIQRMSYPTLENLLYQCVRFSTESVKGFFVFEDECPEYNGVVVDLPPCTTAISSWAVSNVDARGYEI